MVNTPVLFETFVRVDYARQVWDAIKEAQPKKLYFYSNKGRAEKEGEVEKNNEIRSWVKEIDWDCELHTWFREECVDVYTSLRGAISWLFENEEEGIILEDDCVPTKAFFSFVDQLIIKYKDDKRIWCISGDNFIKENPSGYDYFFSNLHAMFGWASWRDRWVKIDWDNLLIDEMLSQHIYYRLFKTREQAIAKERTLKELRNFLETTKCWDYVFGLTIDQHNGVTIQPKLHLIHNIGIVGQHHKSGKASGYNCETNVVSDVYVINREPVFVYPDWDHDYKTYVVLLKPHGLLSKIYNRFKNLLGNGNN